MRRRTATPHRAETPHNIRAAHGPKVDVAPSTETLDAVDGPACQRSLNRAGARCPRFGTFRQVADQVGLGVKMLRRAAREGCFPVYSGTTAWGRLSFSEVERWLRTTRSPITSHANQRLEEVLAAERRKRGSTPKDRWAADRTRRED